MSDAGVADPSHDELLGQIFLSQEGLDDPSPFYHQLREAAPVHQSGAGAVFLSRFDDCRELLRDSRFGKSARGGNSLFPGSDPEAEQLRKEQVQRAIDTKQPASMLFLNPPHHTRQRALVSRAFTPRRVEQLRANIRDIADRLVDEFAQAGGGDLLEAIAFPLPVAVIGTMVGVPSADWPQFRSLITTSAAGIEPTASADELRAASAANQQVQEYFHSLLAERRSSPQDDLLSDLAAVEQDGDVLSDGEIVAVSILLFAAGFETTTNLIGNGMAALLRNPEQQAALWADPSLLPTAVDEMLRWDSPVQLDGRTAFEDVEIDGVLVPEGGRVMTLLGAANRDPGHFDQPDRFDIARNDGPPMSFASGIHYCLGANLSRAEGQEVFGALISRCATIEQHGELERRRRFTLRGFTSVPVTVTAR